MAVTLFEPAFSGFLDANGDPLAGGKVHTYAEGTTTAKATYPTRTDAENGTNANANPVILDSRGVAEIWLASTGLYFFEIDDADDVEIITIDEYGDETDVNALPRSYISGLETSNGTDSDHDVDIATGEARDAADSFDITVSSTITVAIDASGANGLDTGAVASDTLYALWLIADSGGDNDPAGIFSTSFTNPTMPSGYDKKRLIAAVVTDGSSNIVGYTQVGDYFRYTGDVIADISDSSLTTVTFETGTLSAPPNCIALIYARWANASGTDNQADLYIRAVGSADAASAENAFMSNEVAADFDSQARSGEVLLDSSSQMQYAARFSDGSPSLSIETYGFIMLTRRDP